MSAQRSRRRRKRIAVKHHTATSTRHRKTPSPVKQTPARRRRQRHQEDGSRHQRQRNVKRDTEVAASSGNHRHVVATSGVGKSLTESRSKVWRRASSFSRCGRAVLNSGVNGKAVQILSACNSCTVKHVVVETTRQERGTNSSAP